MKNLLKSVLLVAILVGGSNAFAQQTVQFSQYLFHGLHLNPAYAGYREQWNANLSYRNQWVGFVGAPKSASVAIDGTLHNQRVGLGFNLLNDRHGLFTNTSAYATYAYRFPLNQSATQRLSLGLSVGIVQDKLDKSRAKADNIDNVLIDAKPTMVVPDARFGVFYQTNKFFVGASADNLLTHTFLKQKAKGDVFLDRRMHTYLTAGGLFPLSESLSLKPSFLLQDDLAGPSSLDLNTFLLIENILWVGASYRTSLPLYFKPEGTSDPISRPSTIVGLVEAYMGSKFRIGYSYDFTLISAQLAQNSSHELSLGYYFDNGKKAKVISPRYF